MTADPLLAAIRAVPMRCADCSAYSDQEQQLPCGLDPSSTHTWETDDAAIVRAVRVSARAEQQEHIEELEHEILTFKMVVPHCHAFSFSSGNTSDTLPPLDATCVCGITYAAAIRAQGGER